MVKQFNTSRSDGKDPLLFEGSETRSKVFNTSQLNGENGFQIISSAPFFGGSVAGAGDVNNDGIADLIVGAPNDLILQGYHGSAYVIYGAKNFSATFDVSWLNGTNGFTIMTTDYHTVFPTAFLGTVVSGVGDFNGDHIDDIIVTNVNSGSSAVFTIYGANSLPAVFDVSKLNGKDGFKMVAPTNWFNFGRSAGNAKHVNNDSISDIIVGCAWDASVIFGRNDFPPVFQAYLNGTNGFHITDLDIPDDFGFSVAGAGDINGDGYDDVIVGEEVSNNVYVVFGKEKFSGTVNPYLLDGKNGFEIGSSTSNFGFSVAGMDINADGKEDVIIGAPNDVFPESSVFVIYGGKSFPKYFDTSSLNGTNGFRITTSAADSFGWSVANAGDVNGDRIDDLIVSAVKNDQKNNTAVYVVYGSRNFPAEFYISSLDGTNGFEIVSPSSNFGLSVAGAGDVNGDHIGDLIIGAPYSNMSFVIFGHE